MQVLQLDGRAYQLVWRRLGLCASGSGRLSSIRKSGELINEDNTILLQSQPLKFLLMLIDRGGEMVTRREIQQRLWGNDVIVDFDHSINTLVRKLSHALGDSVDGPTYIETLARRGYRLKVPSSSGREGKIRFGRNRWFNIPMDRAVCHLGRR
jgi:DNA-binding winged helix-turn-helix (wHTH) protein